MDGKSLRGTLATLGVFGLVTGGVLIGLPRLLPASLTAIPQGPAPRPAPATAQADPAPDAAAAPAEVAEAGPSFDTVRLEPDGSGLIAGRTDPGSLVSVLLEAEVVAQETADEQGRFVAFLTLDPSDQPRALSLRDEDGTPSDETVILAPTATARAAAAPQPSLTAEGAGSPLAETEQIAALDLGKTGPESGSPPRAEEAALATPAVTSLDEPEADALPSEVDGTQGPPEVASAAPDPTVAPDAASAAPAASPSADTAPAVAASSPIAPPAQEPAPQPGGLPSLVQAAPDLPAPDLPEAEPALPAQAPVLVSDAEGVRVLQPALAPGASPEVLATVALDAIAYDGAGEVVLTGRASGGGAVRLYIDNQPVADAPIAADGTWTSSLGSTGPGVYTLRVDQLGPEGEVVSRIETPFQREARDQLAAAMAEASEPGQTIVMRTVQPGNTLWAIARERYGEPLMYVRVFEANRDRIRDADLIYPGQVFVLPATEGR
jgi:nucleoid-associated protein YgaU